MNKELRNKIVAVRGLVKRNANPAIVSAELDVIFEMLKKEPNKAELEYALEELTDMAIELQKGMGINGLIENILRSMKFGKKNKKTIEVKLIVKEFADAILIKPNKLMPLEGMEFAFNKSVKDFKKHCKDIRVNGFEIWFVYDGKRKDVFLNFNECEGSDELKKMYIDNFLSYINK